MLGQLTLARGGRGRAEAGDLYGLPVLLARTDPEGFWGIRRLRRAGTDLRRAGVLRVLVPRGFQGWGLWEGLGLRRIETEHFLRAQALPLALGALERRGTAPDRATVALRGGRADREMARAAVSLCRQVRHLVIDAPGGEALAGWLRRELGVPILPRQEEGELALCFAPNCRRGGETALELYGATPDLGGLALAAPALAGEDRDDLPLLAALWEGGKLTQKEIKVLDRTGESTYNDKESITVPIDGSY